MVQQFRSLSETDAAIRQMVEIIVDGWDPVQVVLFGSRARGDFHDDSDVDLLVVLDEIENYSEQQLAMHRALACTNTPRDIKLATPLDVVRKATVAGTIERAAMIDGKTLHVRGRGDPVAESVLQWLELSRMDLRGGRLMLAANPTEPALACFHVQQSVEKSLKAALVAERIDPPRIHHLLELRALLHQDWNIPGSDAELEQIGKWAEKSRYSFGYEEFTDSTAAWGIETAQAIYDAVVAGLAERGVVVE
ncbi:MAG: HEPN domain-containing protein [Chloroflexi bacterium]|nr:HEPN domain-containing protein [Chloroflexota bacterium]